MSAPLPPSAPPAPVAPVAVINPAVAPQPSGSWTIQLARLVGWELFLAWRRRGMVITLAVALLTLYALTELFLWLSWLSATDSRAQSAFAQLLAFPSSTSFAGEFYNEIGTPLLIVLAGALIGSEYAYGTHRLSLARGVARGQLLAAQVLALAVLALVSSAAMLLLGSILGFISALAIGGGQAISVGGLGELGVFWLAVALNAFAYGLIALWIGTIGRSVAGAIAGPLIYIFVEVVATGILSIFRYTPNPDALTRLIAAIPDYLLGNNTGELIQLSGQSPYRLLDYSGHLGVAHALVMVTLYCVVFIASAYFIFRSRDVRE